jgi:hypothetical protein
MGQPQNILLSGRCHKCLSEGSRSIKFKTRNGLAAFHHPEIMDILDWDTS